MYGYRYTINKRISLSIIYSLFLFLGATAQNKDQVISSSTELVSYSNDIYGSDDKLVNGRIYVPMHSLAEGHPYFEVENWVNGDIFIKGSRYNELKLKYDIELDEFILFVKDKQNRKNYIVLNQHYIDSVQMGKYFFINTGVLPEIGEDIGYAELVFRKDFFFLVKYHKDFKKEFSESKPYGEYNRQTSNRYISESGELVKINTKKALLTYFEAQKKEIKRFMKKNNIKYKKANSGELYNLLRYCHEARKI